MSKLKMRYRKIKGKTEASFKVPAGTSDKELMEFIRRHEKEMMKRINDNKDK